MHVKSFEYAKEITVAMIQQSDNFIANKENAESVAKCFEVIFDKLKGIEISDSTSPKVRTL